MYPEIDRILIDESRIASRVRAMGTQIASDLIADFGYTGSDQIVLVPILTGSIVFVADLIRHLPLKLRLGVVAVSSYPGRSMQSKGAAIRSEIPPDLAGKHVLVVDDILDSGRTLGLIRRLILEQKPASLRIAVLLRKKLAGGVARAEEVPVDYAGFEIPDEFVVGYGLDYDGYFRNYPQIAVVRVPDADRGGGGGAA
jgi:hypoxanthine phosphoribosyltransferase